MSIQRYGLSVDYDGNDNPFTVVDKDPDGEYIKYSDIAQLEKDLAACRSALADMEIEKDNFENQMEDAICEAEEIADDISLLRSQKDKAEQERDALRIALIDALKLLDQADFRNGNTEPTGTLDEGEVLASRWIHDIRKALKP